MSIPEVTLIIERYNKIKVKYYDIEGKAIRKPLASFMSKLFQHEIDQLNGILMLNDKSRIKQVGLNTAEPGEKFDTIIAEYVEKYIENKNDSD